jgi:translocation and assembly module TamB
LLCWRGCSTASAGRDFLLARIVAALPADAHLSWTSAEGPAAGPMTLRGVRFAWHGHELRAAEVRLDPALQPLVWRKLRLDGLQVRDAQLSIARSDEPFELPAVADSLPAISTPLPIQADHVEVDGLRVHYDGAPVLAISRLRAGLEVDAGRLHVEQLQLDQRSRAHAPAWRLPAGERIPHCAERVLAGAGAGRAGRRRGWASAHAVRWRRCRWSCAASRRDR